MSTVLRQIAVLLNVTPNDETTDCLLRAQDVDVMRTLRLPPCGFLLSLAVARDDAETTYAHGYLRSLDDGNTFPIRSNRELFDALSAYFGTVEGEEE